MESRREPNDRVRIGWTLAGAILIAAAIQACDSRPLPLASAGGGSGGSLGAGGTLGAGGQSALGGAPGSGGLTGAGGTPGAGGANPGVGGSAGVGGACGSPSCTPGTIQEFHLPPRSVPAAPSGITLGPDGNLWFTEFQAGNIGRITPGGVITEFPVGPGSQPAEIITGPDGHLWFGQGGVNSVGRLAIDGTVQGFMLPSPASGPAGLAAGPDGNVWVAESGSSKIGRFQPSGKLVEFPTPSPNARPYGIVAGPDGNLWFGEPGVERIAIMATTGSARELTGVPNIAVHDMALGGDGNIWFTAPGTEQIGTIFPGGMVAVFPALVTNAMLPWAIARGPRGELWYTFDFDRDQVGQLIRLALDGTQSEYRVPHPSPGVQSLVGGMTTGPDRAIWFTEYADDIIGRLVPQ